MPTSNNINQALLTNLATASLRAPEGYNLPEVMTQNKALFNKYGGHPCAAGFSADINNLMLIKVSFNEGLKVQKHNIQSTNLVVDTDNSLPTFVQQYLTKKNVLLCQVEDITLEFLKQILDLDPFGQNFPTPELLINLGKSDVNEMKFFGDNSQHLKIFFGMSNIEIVYFNLDPDEAKSFKDFSADKADSSCWVKGKVSQSTWNNKTSLNLIGV